MKKFLLTLSLIATVALFSAPLARAESEPSPSASPAAISAAPSLAVDQSLSAPVAAFFDADRWTNAAISVVAIAIALAACAYLPKCYRSLGALLRYLAKRLRDPIDRLCLLWRFDREFRDTLRNNVLALLIISSAAFSFAIGRPDAGAVILFCGPASLVMNRRQLCATPQGKLAAVTSNPMVREYAQGAAQGAMDRLAVAAFLAPTVQVAGMIGRYKKYDEKNRFRIPRTRRVLGGAATQIGFTASDALFQANANALDFPIDNLEKLEDADLTNVVNEASDMVAEVAALSWESEVVNGAIAALGAGSNAVWDAATDPVKYLDQVILNVLKAAKSGSMMTIKLLFGASAWLIFKNHIKVTNKFTNNPKGGTNPQVTRDMASTLLLTEPEILTTYSVYDTAPEGVAEAIQFLLDAKVIVFASKASPTRLDPSFMKTFAPRGQFMVPGTYPLQDQRGEVVKFDWNCTAEVTNAAAGTLLNIAEA